MGLKTEKRQWGHVLGMIDGRWELNLMVVVFVWKESIFLFLFPRNGSHWTEFSKNGLIKNFIRPTYNSDMCSLNM
jgi:hypothetical protein